VVKVSYDPIDPKHAEIDSAMSRVLYPLILGFMGFVMLCIGSSFLLIGTLVTLAEK